MQFFNLQVWRDLAWNRFQRGVRQGTKNAPRRGLEEQWFRDAIYIDKLSKLIDWCKSRKIEVVFGKRQNGVYYPDSKEIVITSRASPEKQLYYVLHECGHHLIGIKEHHGRFNMGYPQQDNKEIRRTFHHRVSCLEEELEAWHRGFKLAQRLKLDIDKEEFDNLRLECIRSYLKWALETRGSGL